MLASFWDMERHGRRVATFRRGAIDEHILRPLRNPRKIREREPESDRGSCTEKGQRHGDLSINVGRCLSASEPGERVAALSMRVATLAAKTRNLNARGRTRVFFPNKNFERCDEEAEGEKKTL